MEIGILKTLRGRNGNAIILACVIVIVLLMISGAIMEYVRLTIIAGGIRDALQASVISVSTQNYDETYPGLREGYSGGYKRANGGWENNLDYGDVYTELDKLLGLNSSHVKISGSDMEYSLSDLDVVIINVPFAPSNPNAGNKLTTEAKITMEAPLSFGWGVLPPIRITIKTIAGYTPKF